MAVKSYKMGAGTLVLGDTAPALIDISCQITSATLSPDKSKDDDLHTLCGGTLAGETTYTWSLKATIVQDLTTGGINEYSMANAGQQVPFKFVPSTATAKGYQGTLIVDPLAIGGDVSTKPTADVEWSVVGTPTPYTPA